MAARGVGAVMSLQGGKGEGYDQSKEKRQLPKGRNRITKKKKIPPEAYASLGAKPQRIQSKKAPA